MNVVFKVIEDFNPGKENLIVYDHAIAVTSNKKLSYTVTVPCTKDVRLNTTHFFIIKIQKKREV